MTRSGTERVPVARAGPVTCTDAGRPAPAAGSRPPGAARARASSGPSSRASSPTGASVAVGSTAGCAVVSVRRTVTVPAPGTRRRGRAAPEVRRAE